MLRACGMLAVRAEVVAMPRGAATAGVACGVARAVETPGAGAGAGSDSCVACEAQPATRARDRAVRLAVRVFFMLISPSGYVLPALCTKKYLQKYKQADTPQTPEP